LSRQAWDESDAIDSLVIFLAPSGETLVAQCQRA
jgi:hypothetical protein